MTILLVPVIRFIIAQLILAIAAAFSNIAIWGWNGKDENGRETILPDSRKIWLKPIPYLARMLLFSWGFHHIEWKGVILLVELCNYLTYYIQDYDPKARVIVSNHTSMADGIFVFCRVLPMVIAKADVADMMFFGAVLKASQSIFVDRVNKDNKKFTLDEMTRRTRLPRAAPLLIFPEGTTTNSTCLSI